jgi:hypothetical protein
LSRLRRWRASKGGITTTVLALADALRQSASHCALPVHCCDPTCVAAVIDCVEFGGPIADKAFDSDAIIAELMSAAPKSSRAAFLADKTDLRASMIRLAAAVTYPR